jgi:hypothetical protein
VTPVAQSPILIGLLVACASASAYARGNNRQRNKYQVTFRDDAELMITPWNWGAPRWSAPHTLTFGRGKVALRRFIGHGVERSEVYGKLAPGEKQVWLGENHVTALGPRERARFIRQHGDLLGVSVLFYTPGGSVTVTP